jgi:hypothetical protein
MPHAMVRISEHQRETLLQHKVVRIRQQFAETARACYGAPVLVYQSVRQAKSPDDPVGCFAMAIMGLVLEVPGDSKHFDVVMEELRPLTTPHHGMGDNLDMATKRGRIRGWVMASDVRVISEQLYLDVAGRDAVASQAHLKARPYEAPHFRNELIQVRDAAFHRRLYEAYEGKCAISAVTMCINGQCGLQAAHCYPVSQEPRFDVSAGILLAPSWHARLDLGQIIINDDYSWTAVVEDSDTLAITNRSLLLPVSENEKPDRELLRKRRAMFGFP